MPGSAVRSTLYLDPALHQALRLKAATTHRGMSDLVNDAYGLPSDDVRVMWETAPPRMPVGPRHSGEVRPTP